jgi:hypothetical protein
MKKNFVKICAVLLGFTLVACLEDDKYALDPDGSYNVIEFIDPSVPNSPSGAVYPLWTAVTAMKDEYTFSQTISYSGPNTNDSDIDLLVEVDPTALDEYNLQMTEDLHSDTYEMMPPAYYDFPPLALTIEKGSNKVTFDITVFPAEFDLERSFALPLRITSASEGVLSQHFSAAMFVVVVKNLYDGIYEVTGGSITRNSATGPDAVLGGPFNDGIEIPFTTINGVTTAFQPTWKEGSGVGGIDGTRVTVQPGVAYVAPAGFTAPATANPATVTATTNGTLANTTSRLNYYDLPSKTFVLNFAWGAAPSDRIIQDYTLVYDRER